jgi:hypothetical protein
VDEGDVQLNEVNDADRMKIVELYRQRPVLWTKGRNATREELAEAWSFIRDGVSQPNRQFGLQLTQKITKNLRDQYVRLQRRGAKTNWRYLQVSNVVQSFSNLIISSLSAFWVRIQHLPGKQFLDVNLELTIFSKKSLPRIYQPNGVNSH